MAHLCKGENNAHRSIAVVLKIVIWIPLQIILLLFSCTDSSIRDENIRLNPGIDSIYHFSVKTSEQNSHSGKPTVKRSDFKIAFRPVNDTIYDFTFQFTSIDTSLLTYLDEADSLRRRITKGSEAAHRLKYSQVYDEARHDVFHGRIRSNGVILSVKGFDEMKKRISRLLKLDQRDVYSMLHGEAGDELVEQLLNMVLLIIPGKKIMLKDTWVRNETINTRAPVKNSHLITYSSMIGDTAVMDVQTVVSAKTGDEGSVYKLGKGTGEWKIDRNTGLPYEWNSQQLTEYRTNHDTINFSLTIKGSMTK